MDSRGAREIAAAKTLPTGESGPNSLESRREKERKKSSYTQKEKFLMFTR